METHWIVLYICVVVTFMIMGISSNTFVVWLHTRRHSQLARNKFPLIFAVLDLAAIAALPVRLFRNLSTATATLDQFCFEVSMFVFIFAMNGYLLGLLMATVDKFYAVFYPFKYRLKQNMFFKTALFLTFVWNLVFTSILRIRLRIFFLIVYRRYIFATYFVYILLIFLSTIILYACIVIQLAHGRKFEGARNNATG